MRIARGVRMGVSFATFSLFVLACSAPDAASSSFKRKGADTAASGGGGGGGDNVGDLSGGGGSTSGSDVTSSSACAVSTTKAQNAPVNLVFMVDRSGSMDDSGKWVAATAALKAFFADASGTGLRASLHFFAAENASCDVASYATPAVAMTALPNGPSFAAALDATKPNGSTPTLPALQGAVSYGKTLQAATPDVKVVVVLVTDGEPSGCQSTVDSVSAAAAASAATIPTYVIGVGDALTSLNAVALSGGTKQAVIVSTTNPANISADFGAAIADIRQRALSCDYALPSAPAGESFDLNKVNVQFTPGGAATGATLAYNKDCAGGAGWHYDDANAPTKIAVCPSSCDALKKDSKGKMDILFGCATKGGVIR